MDFPVYLVLWPIILVVVLLFILVIALSQGRKMARARVRHVGEDFSEQMEFDLRLTYKRFRELYPFSTITYQDYKKLQMERAFRKAVSSEKNKRMVR
jgi:hypothetical protein